MQEKIIPHFPDIFLVRKMHSHMYFPNQDNIFLHFPDIITSSCIFLIRIIFSCIFLIRIIFSYFHLHMYFPNQDYIFLHFPDIFNSICIFLMFHQHVYFHNQDNIFQITIIFPIRETFQPSKINLNQKNNNIFVILYCKNHHSATQMITCAQAWGMLDPQFWLKLISSFFIHVLEYIDVQKINTQGISEISMQLCANLR